MITLYTFIGIAIGISLVIFSIAQITSSMIIFYSLPGLGIIVGGLITSLLISYRSVGAFYLFQTIWEVITRTVEKPSYTAKRFTNYAKLVAKGGYFELEKEIPNLGESIEKTALELLVAGYNKDDIKYIIQNTTIERMSRLKDDSKLLKNLASYAPGFGMIGTVIGLIAMLHDMGEDISSIGPAMAVALITTLYGITFSMAFFVPLAEKTRRQLELTSVNYLVILDGITYLHEKRNYVFMRDALNAHLLPKHKIKSDERK